MTQFGTWKIEVYQVMAKHNEVEDTVVGDRHIRHIDHGSTRRSVNNAISLLEPLLAPENKDQTKVSSTSDLARMYALFIKAIHCQGILELCTGCEVLALVGTFGSEARNTVQSRLSEKEILKSWPTNYPLKEDFRMDQACSG